MEHFGLKCFSENLQLFCNPKIDPEKWNLYNGLRGMAEDLIALSRAVEDIQSQIHQIKVDH